jgi:hypothetical protein
MCHFGYWWGLDWPPPAQEEAASQRMTLWPIQDTTIGEWETTVQGRESYLTVRQPGVTSTLVQFDLAGLPYGSQIVSAQTNLYSPAASNLTNRLYMTAYPLTRPWAENEATLDLSEVGSPGLSLALSRTAERRRNGRGLTAPDGCTSICSRIWC